MGLPPLDIDATSGLTNLIYGRSYALCKSMMCRKCGHMFVDYRFSDREMESLYADYRGEEYVSLRESYEPGYTQRNKLLADGVAYLSQVEEFLDEFMPSSDIAILDWGGDTGVNTPFKGRRSSLHIFDPSDKATGLTDTLTFASVPSQRSIYDLIVLSNVLEHIPFPSETLNELMPFMGPETILYVEIPLEAIQQSAAGPPYSGAQNKKHWHEHINFFTPDSIEILLEKSGFTIVSKNLLDISDTHEESGISVVSLLQYACRLAEV